MPTEEVIMSIQSENQNILTDHSQTLANCTSPQITPSFEWNVTKPDKALNDNNPQQFPIQASNTPQPLHTTSLPSSNTFSNPNIDINLAHLTQKGNSLTPPTSISNPLFSPINDSQQTRASHSKNLNQDVNSLLPLTLDPNPNLTPPRDSFTPRATSENPTASPQPPKPKWTRIERLNHTTPVTPDHTYLTLGKRTPMQAKCYPELPSKCL